MLQTARRPGRLLEDLNRDSASVPRDPFVEDPAQEISVGLGGGGVRTSLVHDWEEDQGAAADIAEEPVDRERLPHVQVVHDRDDVGGNLVLAQQLVAAHGLHVGGLAAPGPSIGVVQFRRAVQAEADMELLGREKADPFFIQQAAIGLDTVDHAPAGGPMPALKLDHPLEIIHAQDSGLSPVPGEGDHPLRRRLDVLNDVLFEQAFRHPQRARLGIETALVEVVTVTAVEIADGSGGLGEDLKLAAEASH